MIHPAGGCGLGESVSLKWSDTEAVGAATDNSVNFAVADRVSCTQAAHGAQRVGATMRPSRSLSSRMPAVGGLFHWQPVSARARPCTGNLHERATAWWAREACHPPAISRA
jgi:hypothetical protein